MDYGTEHFRTGWRIFTSAPRVFVTSMLILLASWVALEVAVFSLHGLGIGVWLILHLLFLSVFSGLLVGFFRLTLRVANGDAPDLTLLTASVRRGPAFLLAVCIYSTAVLIGLVLFVVPGIFVAVRYALFGHVLADRSSSAPEGLRQAAALSRGKWWTVFRFAVIALLFNLGGLALFGLGLFVTFPVSLLAASSLYLSLARSLEARG